MGRKETGNTTMVNRINKELWEDFLFLISEGLYDRTAVLEDALKDWIQKNKKGKK